MLLAFPAAAEEERGPREITYDYGNSYFDAFITKEHCLCPKCVTRREKAKAKTSKK